VSRAAARSRVPSPVLVALLRRRDELAARIRRVAPLPTRGRDGGWRIDSRLAASLVREWIELAERLAEAREPSGGHDVG
jgi:hypothetical protein